VMVELEMQHTALRILERRLEGARPHEIINEALASTRPGKLAVVSSFGTESAALLALVAEIDKSVPVLFLDTGWLFEETLRYRDEIAANLGLTDVRSLSPSPEALALRDPERDLWFSDPDACCNLRKVQPLSRALSDFDAWLTGRKRYQGDERSRLPAVEADGEKLKFNPFAFVTREEIGEIFRAHNLPPHPLEAKGFASVGCMACTSRVAPGEGQRAGRWRGRDKTECGIHAPHRSAGV
jgi:phosphoadenosine phosphosulfate reductase